MGWLIIPIALVVAGVFLYTDPARSLAECRYEAQQRINACMEARGFRKDYDAINRVAREMLASPAPLAMKWDEIPEQMPDAWKHRFAFWR